MSRPLRPPNEGGTYHVMNRGNRKLTVFEDDVDRHQFLRIMAQCRDEYSTRILAHCLMGNHFHLIVVTPGGNISTFMEQLQGRFAQFSNWRHHRSGHVFQGRFTSVDIDDDVHLLTAACYVFMNPVAAEFSSRPEHWQWSSYAPTAGIAPVPPFLTIDWLQALFPEYSLSSAQRQLRQLMVAPEPVSAYLEQNDLDLTEHHARRVVRSYVGDQRYTGRIPRQYRRVLRPSLRELFDPNMSMKERNATIEQAHLTYGYTWAALGQHLCLHPTTVSRVFRKRCRAAR